tara:strand:- start:234 stop:578 length:345 start_codon:yes stop_codon:yes gene_type:complete
MMGEAEEIVVRLPQKNVDQGNVLKVIWLQITSGIGLWGSFKPIIAVIVAMIPFLFLGQHFNRQHRRAVDWTLLQIPLIFTVFFWIGLYLWSIFDAWMVATESVKTAHNERHSAT